jgi:perosamine synthetase
MSRIYYTKPSITELEIRYASDAAAHGWGDRCYEYIEKFETLFRKHIGTRYAIATSSCTGALHLGLAALGIKPGDEVILADINWIASAAPITYLGAKPVFVDILPDTWCIDPQKIEEAITSRTKAIIAVHLYGNLCEMDEITKIGRKYNIAVIEDAAEAIGSIYKSKRAGSIGDFGIFSFHGSKTITTGEGGMFVTNREDLYDIVRTMNNHGRNARNPKQFWCEMIGFKYKISNLQAAIGCAQMERVDELISRKREIFFNYLELFKQNPDIRMNPVPVESNTQYGYWMPTIVFKGSQQFKRQKLLDRFKVEDIDGRVFFYPLSSMPMFAANSNNTVSYYLYSRALNLPSYHDLTIDEIYSVYNIINESLINT